MVRWTTTLSWWRAVWLEPRNVSSPSERCGFGAEKFKLDRPYKISSEWIILWLLFPTVFAGAHISQVQRGHRAQIHRHHLQIWPRTIPDRPGEEGFYGERENCCGSFFFRKKSSYLNLYFWFTCRGHWRRMPLNRGHRPWRRKPEKNIQQHCSKCFGKSSVLRFWNCICCNSHLQFNITNKQNACFESFFLFLWPFKKNMNH